MKLENITFLIDKSSYPYKLSFVCPSNNNFGKNISNLYNEMYNNAQVSWTKYMKHGINTPTQKFIYGYIIMCICLLYIFRLSVYRSVVIRNLEIPYDQDSYVLEYTIDISCQDCHLLVPGAVFGIVLVIII